MRLCDCHKIDMEVCEAVKKRVVFSLVCMDCDADGPGTLRKSIKEGWTHLNFDPEYHDSNFLGYCPNYSESAMECIEKQPELF